MKRGKRWVPFIMICIGFLVCGCSESVHGETAHAPRVAGIISTKSNYWQEMLRGMEEGCEELGLSFFALDISLQDKDVMTWSADEAWKIAVMSDVDAIIADGNLHDLEIVQEARDKGIAIVLVDSDSQADLRDAYVGTDNVQAGRLAVQALNDLYGINGEPIVVQSNADVKAVSDRFTGICEALQQECPDMEIEYPQVPWYKDRSFNSSLEETILAYPNLQAIFGLMEPEAKVYAQVLKRLNMDQEIKLITFDLSDEILGFLREGVIDAVVVQQSYEIGYQSVKIVDMLLKGQKLERDTVYIDCFVLDQNNLSLFEEKEMRENE